MIPSARRLLRHARDSLTPPRALGVLALMLGMALIGGLLLLGSPSRSVPVFSHIWVIFMENRDYSQVIGSAEAPYINQLARRYGLATNYYGIVHGSQPNYIGFFSGATYGVTGGSTPNLPARNLVDQLETAGRTWHVYAQNYPGGCFNKPDASGGPDGAGVWVRRHTPALAFTDIRKNPVRCARITDLGSFDPMAAQFELIVPNLTSSMHDGTTRQGDDFLRDLVPRILASPAWKEGGVLFIVWDEGRENGPNRVPLLAVSPLVARGSRSGTRYDHYSLLATIEAAWHLGCLGNACEAETLHAFFSR